MESSKPTANPANQSSQSRPDLSSKERLLKAAKAAIARHGWHAMSISELLSAAGVPKGVLYHHFPKGKAELAAAAIAALGEQSARNIAALADPNVPLETLLNAWFDHAGERLAGSKFELGCPLAIAAMEVGTNTGELRLAVSAAFTGLQEALKTALTQRGIPAERASAWAQVLISSYEGGLLQARVHQSLSPLQNSVKPLIHLLAEEVRAQGR
jgi:TetR/AcrR family transcriptional regulator, lmrAB and yxaGH operons repressor